MFLPLGTDRPLARPTLMNYVLIGANVLVYIAQVAIRYTQSAADAEPHAISRFDMLLWLNPQHFHWWSLITYQFLHGNLPHIAGNMLFLWVFGANVEDRFGRLGYLAFYLVGGAAAGGAHVLFAREPVLGASGAIAAVAGAYFVLFPKTRIKCLWFIFIIGVYWIPAMWFIAFEVGWNILQQALGSDTVAHVAHLGGYAFGIVVSLCLLWSRILGREPYDLFTMIRQGHRRRQIRSVGQRHDKAMRQRWERARDNSTPDGAQAERIAAARAEVTSRLAANDPDGAAEAYRSLVTRFGDRPGAVTLSRQAMYDMGNHLAAVGDHQSAADVFELFLRAYPRDHEAAKIKLLLGFINARYLNDPIRAKQLLAEAAAELTDSDEVGMARRELEALA